jgi:hypothetical protein
MRYRRFTLLLLAAAAAFSPSLTGCAGMGGDDSSHSLKAPRRGEPSTADLQRREAAIQAAFEAHPEWSPQVKDYIRKGWGAKGMTLPQLRLAFYDYEWTCVSTRQIGRSGEMVETWEITSPPPFDKHAWAQLFFRDGKLVSFIEATEPPY